MREHMETHMLAQALKDAGLASTTPTPNTDACQRQQEEEAMWLLRGLEKRRERRGSRRRK
jgi:hypothetical protein